MAEMFFVQIHKMCNFVGAVFTTGSYRLYSLDCIHYRIVSGLYSQDDFVRLYFLEDVVRVVFTR